LAIDYDALLSSLLLISPRLAASAAPAAFCCALDLAGMIAPRIKRGMGIQPPEPTDVPSAKEVSLPQPFDAVVLYDEAALLLPNSFRISGFSS
jgi:hypothetical protein